MNDNDKDKDLSPWLTVFVLLVVLLTVAASGTCVYKMITNEDSKVNKGRW